MSDILNISRKLHGLLSDFKPCHRQAGYVGDLIEKLENEDITVSVIGQFKRGKSTLSNAILEDEIMPVGIIPVTSAVTKVEYGDKSATVYFNNGSRKNIPFEELSDYISEQKNGDNKKGVKEVGIKLKSDFLKDGLVYVDTPGVGSFHKNNTEVAYDYMKESDAVIFLLSVDSPINQIEIDFLRNAGEYAGKFYFAVNKIDMVSEEDLEAYVSYCANLIREIMDVDAVKIYPVSAKSGAGVEALKSAIIHDCKTHIREIMIESTRKKLIEGINQSLSQLSFYRKAMKMPGKELQEQFALMKDFAEDLKTKATNYRGLFEIHLNETKLSLSEKVHELFGMEYVYDLQEMKIGAGLMNKEDFLQEVYSLCDNLEGELNDILLYKEENAYTVVRKISDINRLDRELHRIKKEL